MADTFKSSTPTWSVLLITFFSHLPCLHWCSVLQQSYTVFGNYNTIPLSKQEKKTIYISHPAMFWLLQVINDNGHLPKIQTQFTNGIGKQLYDKCGKYILLLLWYIPFFIHKIKGFLKFYLHIIMHEITAFIMLYIERHWIDLVNQGTQPIFSRTENYIYQ